MLSVQRCRELLGASAPSSDEDIEELRSQLYAVAVVWLGQGARPLEPSTDSLLSALPEDDRVGVEERAAVLEYDGGVPRDLAERAAITDIFRTPKNGRSH